MATKTPHRDEKKMLQMVEWTLPEDITYNILSRLPIKSVMRCRCVCRTWGTMINDPLFIDMHLSRSIQDKNRSILLGNICCTQDREINTVRLIEHVTELEMFNQPTAPLQLPPYDILGSCNGLLCLCSFPRSRRNQITLYICNPLTRESIELPRPNIPFSVNDCTFEFGYGPRSHEYKVFGFVVSYHSIYDYHIAEAQVFTLGTNSWRRIVDVPFLPLLPPFNVLVNGALHWLAYFPHDSVNLVIGSFDIGDEKFRVLPVPPGFSPSNGLGPIQVEELEGILALVDFSSRDHVDVWEMKCYNYRDSWTKQYVVRIPEYVISICLLCVLDNGKLLLRHNNDEFISYDPYSNQVKSLETKTLYDVVHSSVHVGSLVSPRRFSVVD